MLQQANKVTNEARERATGYANKLGNELSAVEDRIKELEAVTSHYRERATFAEEWMQRIRHEIEEKLIAPHAAARAGLPGNALRGQWRHPAPEVEPPQTSGS